MRCKKHPTDLSSAVGVCASCLRQSLFAVMAAQAELHRKSDTQQQPPPTISFPRSVSPYISRRKSDTATATWLLHGGDHHHKQQRFYSTPHVGPTGSVTVEIDSNSNRRKSKGARSRFASLFLGLFRSKSDMHNSNPRTDPGVSIDSCTSSPSWLSTVITGRRKKKNRTFSLNEDAIGAQPRPRRYRDRGMSPERYSDEEDDEHCHGGLSGYSSESSQGWRQTPRRTPASTRRRRGENHNSNVSGLTFCLSPLVRASPSRNWNQKVPPPEMTVAGESRAPHLSTATSFCKNRSRKLADFGRYSYNTNH